MKKSPVLLQLLWTMCLLSELYIGIYLVSSLFGFAYATSVVESKRENIAFVIGPGIPTIYFTHGGGGFSGIQEISLMGLHSLWFTGLTPVLSWEGYGNVSFGPFPFTTGARYRLGVKNMSTEAVQMDSLSGMVSFIRPTNPGEILNAVRFPYLVSLFSFCAFNLSILEMLRRMLKKVQRGDAFTHSNVRGIQAIGIFFVLSGVVQPLVVGWVKSELAAYALDHLTTGIHLDVRSIANYSVVFTGAVILALAEVFRQAVILKEENTLTI